MPIELETKTQNKKLSLNTETLRPEAWAARSGALAGLRPRRFGIEPPKATAVFGGCAMWRGMVLEIDRGGCRRRKDGLGVRWAVEGRLAVPCPRGKEKRQRSRRGDRSGRTWRQIASAGAAEVLGGSARREADRGGLWRRKAGMGVRWIVEGELAVPTAPGGGGPGGCCRPWRSRSGKERRQIWKLARPRWQLDSGCGGDRVRFGRISSKGARSGELREPAASVGHGVGEVGGWAAVVLAVEELGWRLLRSVHRGGRQIWALIGAGIRGKISPYLLMIVVFFCVILNSYVYFACLSSVIRVVSTHYVMVLCRIRLIFIAWPVIWFPRMVFETPIWLELCSGSSIWPKLGFGTSFLREFMPIVCWFSPIWYSDTVQDIISCKRIIIVVVGFVPQSLVGDLVRGVFCFFKGFVCLFHSTSLFRDLYALLVELFSAVMDFVQFKD